MKKLFSNLKFIFTLLLIVSVIAIAAGVYLGAALGLSAGAAVTTLSAAGMLLWAEAWGTFLMLCLHLRKGESAFTASTGKALTIIGWCMAGLAVVTLVCALTAPSRSAGFLLIEAILLPGFFLAVGVAAKLLQGLLTHAMSIEKEQEGVV